MTNKSVTIKGFTQSVQNQLQKQINEQKLIIADTQKPYFMTSTNIQKEKQRIRKIQQQKYRIQNKLKQIKFMEKIYHQEIKNQKAKQNQNKIIRSRSQFTKRDQVKIKELQKKRLLHEKLIKEKRQTFQKSLIEEKMKLKIEQDLKKVEQKQLKKEEITNKLQVLIEKRKKRKQRNEKQKVELKKIQLKKELCDKFLQNWLDQQHQFEKLSQKQQKKRVEQRNCSLKNIQQHEEKFLSIRSQLLNNMKKKRKEQKIFTRSLTPKNFQSKFYFEAQNKYFKKKDDFEKQKQQKSEKIMKMWEYGEVIKTNYPPKMQQPLKQQKEQIKFSSLNPEQRNAIGAQYLEYSKKKINKKGKNQIVSDSINKTVNISTNQPVNYSKEKRALKRKRSKKYESRLKQARNLLKLQNIEQIEKIQLIKALVEKNDYIDDSKRIQSQRLLRKTQTNIGIMNLLINQE